MENILLDDTFKLAFEKLPHKIRLIVFKNGEELVCRKEKLRMLFSFAETNTEHIFKGRLQFYKLGDKINVQVKNKLIGIISNADFKNALNELK
ncbi:hypothetical protein [Pedobacter aquatilis]|uniref:hypothetical protein n=1 Tax=Pedobacter aquatilis TaxID=351343 RepID=UPI002930BD2E|nr:hypothetical protein [Pedobacter aquatilis]